MTLHAILEKESIKEISQKTNVSEENLQILIDEDLEKLTRAKAFGFISIIEREYKDTLESLREKASAYYEENAIHMNYSTAVGLSDKEAQEGSTKWIWLVLLGLLTYGAWSFATQYDFNSLKKWIPFTKSVKDTSTENSVSEKDVSNAVTVEETTSTVEEEDSVSEDDSDESIEIEETTVEGE